MTEPLSLSLSLAEWVVLGVIGERPAHGFAVSVLTADDGELGRIWHIPRPAIYRALGRVEAALLVTADSVEPGRGPQRTIYSITPEGRDALDTWLSTPVRHVREVRSHLLMKLALLDRAGRDPADLLVRQRAVLEPIAGAIMAERSDGDGFDATLLAWRRATASAALSFLDDIMRAGSRPLPPAAGRVTRRGSPSARGRARPGQPRGSGRAGLAASPAASPWPARGRCRP
jgi:PadR family transcriptional regulator AphA